jgi:hypothetical protein
MSDLAGGAIRSTIEFGYLDPVGLSFIGSLASESEVFGESVNDLVSIIFVVLRIKDQC